MIFLWSCFIAGFLFCIHVLSSSSLALTDLIISLSIFPLGLCPFFSVCTFLHLFLIHSLRFHFPFWHFIPSSSSSHVPPSIPVSPAASQHVLRPSPHYLPDLPSAGTVLSSRLFPALLCPRRVGGSCHALPDQPHPPSNTGSSPDSPSLPLSSPLLHVCRPVLIFHPLPSRTSLSSPTVTCAGQSASRKGVSWVRRTLWIG